MKKAELRRRSFFVDDRAVRKAKKVLCVATDSEAIRQAVERVAEMEEFWKFMRESRKKLKSGSMEAS